MTIGNGRYRPQVLASVVIAGPSHCNVHIGPFLGRKH